jgi:arsenite methyltransferase
MSRLVEQEVIMTQSQDEVRNTVREHYGKVAESNGAIGCAPVGCAPGCCAPGAKSASSLALGYSEADLNAVPEGAEMGLGCGNPQAIAALRPGETVLDLGSGGGFDCFLAAKQVGDSGAVIGVDMTPEMVNKARVNARKVDARNVDFRLGEIERLPVADTSVDVILSNCVINLSPNKAEVFREAFRVLRAGGRLAISDVVATGPLPAALQSSLEALSGCVSGAAAISDIRTWLAEAGFEAISVTPRPESRAFIADWLPGSGVEQHVVSATIEARKPAKGGACCGPECCVKGAA